MMIEFEKDFLGTLEEPNFSRKFRMKAQSNNLPL